MVLFRRPGWDKPDYEAWSAQLLADQTGFVTPTTWEGETVARFAFLHPNTTEEMVRRDPRHHGLAADAAPVASVGCGGLLQPFRALPGPVQRQHQGLHVLRSGNGPFAVDHEVRHPGDPQIPCRRFVGSHVRCVGIARQHGGRRCSGSMPASAATRASTSWSESSAPSVK